MFFKVHCVKGP